MLFKEAGIHVRVPAGDSEGLSVGRRTMVTALASLYANKPERNDRR